MVFAVSRNLKVLIAKDSDRRQNYISLTLSQKLGTISPKPITSNFVCFFVWVPSQIFKVRRALDFAEFCIKVVI